MNKKRSLEHSWGFVCLLLLPKTILKSYLRIQQRKQRSALSSSIRFEPTSKIRAPSSGLILTSFAAESSSWRLWVLIKPSGNFTRAVKHADSFGASRRWAFQRMEPQARLLTRRKRLGPSIPPSNERMWLKLLGHAADFSFVSELCVLKNLLSHRGECGLKKLYGCHRDHQKHQRAGKKIEFLHYLLKSNHESTFRLFY